VDVRRRGFLQSIAAGAASAFSLRPVPTSGRVLNPKAVAVEPAQEAAIVTLYNGGHLNGMVVGVFVAGSMEPLLVEHIDYDDDVHVICPDEYLGQDVLIRVCGPKIVRVVEVLVD
jgi:hypothetical protein